MLHKFSVSIHLSHCDELRKKMGRKAWSTRDNGGKCQKQLPSHPVKNWLNFRVRTKFEIKIVIV